MSATDTVIMIDIKDILNHFHNETGTICISMDNNALLSNSLISIEYTV